MAVVSKKGEGLFGEWVQSLVLRNTVMAQHLQGEASGLQRLTLEQIAANDEAKTSCPTCQGPSAYIDEMNAFATDQQA